MPGKSKAVGAALKYGPLVYTAAQKYGPQVVEQLKGQREPAEKFVQDKVAKGNQRKKALQHAGTVMNGSILQVFYKNKAHWIVFSGDEPIAVHPPTSASYNELLQHADLSKRVLPGQRTSGPASFKRRKPANRRGGTKPATSTYRLKDEGEGDTPPTPPTLG
ncbi:hypothetical protein K0651_03185 [Ornithinimicrobium sp. Arc0846-15]|nr:hypothetical protein [Ornithinimicrobium laminariae]